MYGLLILFFLVSIIFSFLCSIWEAVLLSIPPSQVEINYKKGTAVGLLLKSYKDNIDRPLAAILTLNTIAHTVGAIGVGAQAVKIWENTNPFMSAVIVPVAMTLAILLLSEIIPKTLGANYWQRLMKFTVISLRVIIIILYPLVWISQFITRALKKDKSKSIFTRSDFSAMAEIGAESGIFEEGESLIIQNLLRFERIRAKDIMTPRTVVLAADENQTIKEFYTNHQRIPFSRIPVFSDSKDHITGFFLKDKLLDKLVKEEGDAKLLDIRREVLVVNEALLLPRLFNAFMEKREQLALVVDEFGGMAGIVTMEDLIETLLGMEIVDEMDNIDDMQLLARKNWEKRAKALGIIPEDGEVENTEEPKADEAGENISDAKQT
ncbi:MAG: HlyC/CorC family transporter [Bacteroidetes bacterium]|nr:HlyC/CorC family transporter [Bacteroidota bacterium]